ncbi:MAG: Ig-like domain-containing protein, partial [Polyangiaceae bacterium]
ADYTWTFATNTVAEPPTVVSTLPSNGATGVPLGTTVSATFSLPMDPATLDGTTFSVKQGLNTVVGSVSVVGTSATFTPAAPLTASLTYTATIAGSAKDLAGFPLGNDYVWSFSAAASTVPPVVTATTPLDLAVNVPLNSKLTATFSRAMAPATINAATFLVKQGNAPVTGTVSLDSATNTAIFTPTALLSPNLPYTATITTGAKDLGGLALTMNYTWSFTTVAAATPPTVLTTTPLNLATNVTINVRPTATFSGPMNSATITNLSFTLKQGNATVLGAVTFNAANNTATFTPAAPLGLNLTYTATITTDAKDSNGTALATNYTWSFTTSACGQAPVVLGAAANFVVLAGSTVTSTGLSTVTGDLGVSPGTAVTGFPPGILVGAKHAGDPTSAQGIAALTTAYNSAAGRTLCPVTVAGNLGGMTLTPGLYKSTTSLAVSSGDLTLDAQGDGNAIFIFQMASTLTTTSGRQVILTNGAKSANVFWQVGTSATIGTGSVFQGTIMADQAITLETGAKLNGRALARIAAVSLDGNTIVKPLP